MILSPRLLHAQFKTNRLCDRLEGAITIQNIAPVADNSETLSKKEARTERKRMSRLHAKANRRPLFDAALAVRPRACINATKAFAETARMHNTTPHAPEIPSEILESRRALVYGVAGSGLAGSPLPASLPITEPAAPPTDPARVALADMITKAGLKKGKDTRLAAVRKFRKLKARTLAEATEAFNESLRGVRAKTNDRLNNGISNATDIRAETEKRLMHVEVRAVFAARKMLENMSGETVNLNSANLHRAALDNFIVGTRAVHSDPDATVNFGNAIQDFGASFERAYYAMLVRSGCKQVMIIGGGMDGRCLPLKIASMLRSYELLIPADD